jgi:uncharacterized repeat protein (TIGR03803 family)
MRFTKITTSRSAFTARCIGLLLLSASWALGQSEIVLYTFAGGTIDGAYPYSTLVRDGHGNFYGTTLAGGATALWGTVFSLTPRGKEKILHSFTDKQDGGSPNPGLFLDAQGSLYGPTSGGGATGNGTVFKVTAQGALSVLYSFTGGTDGKWPQAGVVADAKGNLYGTTYYGGAHNAGVVFKVTPAGAESVLHHFTGKADGGNPLTGALVRDAHGHLYGTTSTGGAASYGTVFELMPNGTLKTLHTFEGGADGAAPQAGVFRAANGNLYGTTGYGGAYNFGTVFELAPNGHETMLYVFTGGSDGGFPFGDVILDPAGNLYGTTVQGGTANFGTVFELTATGTEKVLYSFTDGADGAAPFCGLSLDKLGHLFGTASAGGASAYGTVFEVIP